MVAGQSDPDPPPGRPGPLPPADEAAEEHTISESRRSIEELLGGLGILDGDDNAAAQESQAAADTHVTQKSQTPPSKPNRFKRAGASSGQTAAGPGIAAVSSGQTAGASGKRKDCHGNLLPTRVAECQRGGRRKCNVCMECYNKADGITKGTQWFRCRACNGAADCLDKMPETRWRRRPPCSNSRKIKKPGA